jgi:hypothetical protein
VKGLHQKKLLILFLNLFLETEDLLKNPIIGKTYTEEFGKYKGISRVVIKKFQIYFKPVDDNVLIIAILFPGENK